MGIKLNYSNISIKQKSLFFVLLLISILLVTLYFQNTTSYRNYLYLLQNSYQNTITNQHKIFNDNLISTYKNITVNFQNETTYEYLKNNQGKTLEQKFHNISNLLKQNNQYLKDINFIQTNKKEQKTVQEQKRFLDIINIKDKFYYRILVPVLNVWSVEYLIDVEILLSNMKKFDGSHSVIFFKDMLKPQNELEKQIFVCCKTQHKNLISFDSKFYVSKLININNVLGENFLSMVFFLDVTKEKMQYKAIIKDSMITSILLFIFAAIMVNYFFGVLIKTINKNEEKLKEINRTLELRVTTEINERMSIESKAIKEKQKNEQLLIQQSKLAMMGEMIGNIAHQWRQPLMQLSAIIMYLDAYNEKGKLTPQKFQKKIGEGVSIIDYMSKTIEDFRNYYKPEKQKEEFFIKQSIESALFIIDSALKSSFIELKIEYADENIKLNSFKNEFSQALLNIISNAKDVLIQRKIKNPQINISVYSLDDKKHITIEDNAHGIEEDIKSRIFEPYFTTKHKSQGTGIGLYMTKMIIENNMNGKIDLTNTAVGAKFTIIL